MDLQQHFQNIRQLIRQAKSDAWEAANFHLIDANWQVGGYLSLRLTESAFGDKVVEKLADWLHEHAPELKGFDRRGLYRLKEFFETWSSQDFLTLGISGNITLPPAQLMQANSTASPIVGSVIPQLPQLPGILARISWTHHLELLRSTNSIEEKAFYLVLSIKERYTVRELQRQIKSCLYERQILSKGNLVLPEHPQKDMLANIFRDHYAFEFLDLPEPHTERQLQRELVSHLKKFLLEMGRDFLFVGEEFRLQVGMDDFAIDLVLFHRELQCLVAFDLKMEKFQPEHLGKMNFYLEALDRDLRKPLENPSIGVVLCKTKNKEVVEYAMSRSLSPALVAAYETKMPDKELLRRLLQQWALDWGTHKLS